MQIPKEEIRKNILAAAKEEFLKNGFERASVRTITSNAKTSKSNAYNYFKDKDALFYAVAEPTLSDIKKGLEGIREKNRSSNEPYSMAAQREVVRMIIQYVFGHSDEFRLLLFRSAGSSLSGFKNDVIEQLAAVLADWVHSAAPDKNISDFFIRSVAGFYVGTMERILIEGKTKEQLAGHLDEYLTFIYGGWSAVFSK